jgi:hypothetical protein
MFLSMSGSGYAINLKDDQEKCLKVLVEEGRFPSVNAAAG